MSSVSMGDMTFATKLRTLVMQLAGEAIDKMRPRPRYGVVYTIDRPGKRAQVILNGDLDPVSVSLGAIQPKMAGQVVRVEGIGFDKYVTDVVGGVIYWGNVEINASQVTGGSFHQDRIPQLKAIDYKIDILYNDPNPITMLRSVPGSNVTGGVVMISPLEFGAIFDNVWKVRFDSSGAMNVGSIPTPHLSGSAGSIDPWLVPGYNRDASSGASWWTTDRSGTWDSGTRMVFNNHANVHNWHFGFWNANGREELLVGDDGQRYFRAMSVYERTTTAGANAVIGWWGDFSRSTSLRAAKAAIEDAPQNWAEKVWDLQPRTWIDKGDADRLADALSREMEGEEIDWPDTMVAPLRRIPGFVAEEVEEAGLEEFLVRDETGELTGLAYDRFSAALLVAMKDEREKRIAAEARVDALEARVESLESRLDALATHLDVDL